MSIAPYVKLDRLNKLVVKYYQSDNLSDLTSKTIKPTTAQNSSWTNIDSSKGKYLGVYSKSADGATGYGIVFNVLDLYAYFNGPVILAIPNSITDKEVDYNTYTASTTVSGTYDEKDTTKMIGSVLYLETFKDTGVSGVPTCYVQMPNGAITLDTVTSTIQSYAKSDAKPIFAHNNTTGNILTLDDKVPYVAVLNTGFSTLALILIMLFVVLLVVVAGVVGYKYYKKRKGGM